MNLTDPGSVDAVFEQLCDGIDHPASTNPINITQLRVSLTSAPCWSQRQWRTWHGQSNGFGTRKVNCEDVTSTRDNSVIPDNTALAVWMKGYGLRNYSTRVWIGKRVMTTALLHETYNSRWSMLLKYLCKSACVNVQIGLHHFKWLCG